MTKRPKNRKALRRKSLHGGAAPRPVSAQAAALYGDAPRPHADTTEPQRKLLTQDDKDDILVSFTMAVVARDRGVEALEHLFRELGQHVPEGELPGLHAYALRLYDLMIAEYPSLAEVEHDLRERLAKLDQEASPAPAQ